MGRICGVTDCKSRRFVKISCSAFRSKRCTHEHTQTTPRLFFGAVKARSQLWKSCTKCFKRASRGDFRLLVGPNTLDHLEHLQGARTLCVVWWILSAAVGSSCMDAILACTAHRGTRGLRKPLFSRYSGTLRWLLTAVMSSAREADWSGSPVAGVVWETASHQARLRP